MQTEQPIIEKVASKAPEKDAEVCIDSVQDNNEEQLAMLLYQIYKNEKEVVRLALDD